MEQQIRVRFAPSPTGYLHIGGARTALFNWLYAKHHGGTFVLRVEDTDLQRSTKEYEKAIPQGMKWLDMLWDEGIEMGGDYGPYRQTERIGLYRQYAQELIDKGYAYKCYCSPEELEAERNACLERGEDMPRYSGRCRELTLEQQAELEAEGRKPVIRFKVPENKQIVIHDSVRGDVIFDSSTIGGDFIIMKSDGMAAYNFAVVIDDALMKMTHVIRGEDHISNTPKQILIYEALGFALPQFAHISMILGKDRTKLSKRHGHTAVDKYETEGYLPEAIFNFLALLGWSPEGTEEILTKDQLIEQFSLERVAKNPAVFDVDKLKWMNNHYLREADLDRVTRLSLPHLVEAGFLDSEEIEDKKFNWLKGIVDLVRERVGCLKELPKEVKLFFTDEFGFETEEAEVIMQEETAPTVVRLFMQKLKELEMLEPPAIKKIFKAITKETGLKGKQVFMPVRVALTGQMHGPDMPEMICILGREKALQRMDRTLHSDKL